MEQATQTTVKTYQIELFWKGLSGEDRKIGKYVVTEDALEKLEEQHKNELDIDVLDETNEKPISYTILIDNLIKSGKEKGLFANGGKIEDVKTPEQFKKWASKRNMELINQLDGFKVGDEVSYTNEYGVVFEPYNIIGIEKDDSFYGRQIYLNKDSYWFPVKLSEIKKYNKQASKSKFSYYKVPNEELYAIQECNPEYKDGFGSECIVIRTKKTEEAAIAEVERLNKLGYSDYAKGGELPQQKDIELLQKGLENPLIPQNVKTKIEAKIKELQSEIDKQQQEAKKAAEKPTLKDLEARLKIVKKMASKKPELKARVKIIEKMIAKEKKATPKMENGGVTTIMTTRDVTTTEDLNELIMPYNRVDGKIFEITSNLGRNRKYEWKGGDDGTLVRKETPKMENGGETTTFIIGNRYKRDSGMGGTLSFEYKGIKDGELVFKNVMHKDYGGGNTETYNLKAAKNTFKPDIKMENGAEIEKTYEAVRMADDAILISDGEKIWKWDFTGFRSHFRSMEDFNKFKKILTYEPILATSFEDAYEKAKKYYDISAIEIPTKESGIERFKTALGIYIAERYQEEVDWDRSLISYEKSNNNNKQIQRAEVTTLQGNEYTVYPADLVDRFENGGFIPVNVALQKTAGQPYEIIKNDIPRTEAQKFIEEYKQSGKPYHNIMIDDLPFEDGGEIPEGKQVWVWDKNSANEAIVYDTHYLKSENKVGVKYTHSGVKEYVPLNTIELMEKGGETWIQDSVDKMQKKGTVGSFTNKAARHGLTPVEYAKKVLANPDKHTEKTRKQAQFVKNTNPDLFEDGGEVKSIPFKEMDYERLVKDVSADYPYYSVKSGSKQEIFEEKTEQKVATWYMQEEELKINQKAPKQLKNDLINWLKRNSYITN